MTAELRSVMTGLLSLACVEEQALLAAGASGPGHDSAEPGDRGGSPETWAAVLLVADNNEFKSQQAERIVAIRSGQIRRRSARLTMSRLSSTGDTAPNRPTRSWWAAGGSPRSSSRGPGRCRMRTCSTRRASAQGGPPLKLSVMSQPVSFYEAVGGEETFRRLVHRFYQGVADDPVLRPVYPARDLGPAEEHLRLFLMQYWGGPRTYDEQRGHPRLRMRHARFAIGEAERDAWLRNMRVALDELALDKALEAQLWEYLVMAAHSLVNVEPADGRRDLGLTPKTPA